MLARISEPCSSLETRRIRWNCQPDHFRPLLQLLARENREIWRLIRQKMAVAEEKAIILTIRCETCPGETIDRYWERLVLVNLRRTLEADALLWNLSTFGGAFSSMGDYDRKWAERAGIVTQHQLKMAIDMGNAVLQARCYLYKALSVAQLGNVDEAKQTARRIYCYGRWTNNKFLANCARGVFYKIRDIMRYLKKRKLLQP